MTSTPWILAHNHWAAVRECDWQVAVLPWGATEPHNYHLPYGTDTIETTAVAHEAARLAWERDARVAVLPAVPFGVQTGQLDLKFALNMNPSTQAALLADLVHALDQQGIGKLVILNGHGGNDFKPMIRELQPRAAVFLCTVDWYRAARPTDFFDEPGDHAGELETSMMLHVAPELVRPLHEAGAGKAKRWRIRAMREGWAWASRPWSKLTVDTGVGDPAASTAHRGARFFDAVTRNIADFLVELANTDIDDFLEISD
jgi:creatinine amidohydrolase